MKLFCASLWPRLSANIYCNSHAWHSHTNIPSNTPRIGTVGRV